MHLRPSADIRAHLRFIPLLFLLHSPLAALAEPPIQAIYCPPTTYHETARYIWQRTYPEEWQKLIDTHLPGIADPFADPPAPATPDDLEPATSDWQRALIPRALEKLGHPVSDAEGTSTIVASDGQSIIITHSADAIRAFDEKFPDIAKHKLTDQKKIAAANSAPTWQDWKSKYPNYGLQTPHITIARKRYNDLDFVLPGFQLDAAEISEAVSSVMAAHKPAHKAAHPSASPFHGISFILRTGVSPPVTIPKSDITVGQAIDTICRQTNLQWEISPYGKIIISTPD